MTLLSLVQDALSEIAIDRVNSVVSTSDPRAPIMLALANRALKYVSKQHAWLYLVDPTPYTFDTVVSQTAYALPDDYDRIITDTAYDASEAYRMLGGVTPSEWQWAAVNGGTMDGKRFLVGGAGTNHKLHLTPAPTGVTTISYFYKSSEYALDASNVSKALFTADDDTSKIPEDLVQLEFKWRYLYQRGLDYGEAFREARESAEKQYAESKNSPTITLGGGRRSAMWPLTDGYVPDTGYGV